MKNSAATTIRKKLIKYLNARLGQTIDRKQITKALKIKTSNSSLSTALTEQQDQGNIDIDRSSKGTRIRVLRLIKYESKAHPNSGIAKKIDGYLASRDGQRITRKELSTALNIDTASKKSACTSKLIHLKKQGKIKLDLSTRPADIVVGLSAKNHLPPRSSGTATLVPIPSPTLADLEPLELSMEPVNLGALVNQLMTVNQQIQNYEQFNQDLLHLLDKYKIIEENK